MNGLGHWLFTRLGWAPGPLAAVIVAAGHEAGAAATPIEVTNLAGSMVSVLLWFVVLIWDGARQARDAGR